MLDYPLLILHLDLNVSRYVNLLLKLNQECFFKLLMIIFEVSIVFKEGTAVAILIISIVGGLLVRKFIAQTFREIDIGF